MPARHVVVARRRKSLANGADGISDIEGVSEGMERLGKAT
jgi:hypothetical protein